MSTPEPIGKRRIGIWIATSLVVGSMIGSGIFLLPASLAIYGGISIVGWLFTATGAVLLALVFGRLARMVPKAGGPYAYTRRGFGEFAGFLVAWGYWIAIISGNAAIAVAMIGYLGVFWPWLSETPAASAGAATVSIWLLTWVNARGVHHAGVLQLVTTVLKLLPLLAIGTIGFLYFEPANYTPFNLSGESNFSAVTATAALTLWAFLGLEAATIPAQEVEDPRRTIPRATIFGTLIAAVVYILATAAVMGLVSPAVLSGSTAPFADAATVMWGSWAAYAVALGAAISCFGALNGWILLQGQIPLAAALDGLFPKQFGNVSGNGVPVFGLVASSLIVTILMATNYTRGLVGLFTFAILLSTLTTLIPYVFSAMAELMIFIREREQFRGERLFGASVIAVLAFMYSVWAIAGAGKETVFWGFLLLIAGIPVYVWIAWRHRAVIEQSSAGASLGD